MKYIRTNDNQIINVEKLKEGFNIRLVGKYLQLFYPYGITPVNTYEITKQTETIEELCDGFEFWNDLDRINGMFVYYDNTDWEVKGGAFERLKRAIEYCKMKEGHYIAKGYIRTEEGLIFVAKMNDEGGLELL